MAQVSGWTSHPASVENISVNQVEAASALMIIVALTLGTMFVMPRPKPEIPPSVETQPVEVIEPHDTRPAAMRVEPNPLFVSQGQDVINQQTDQSLTEIERRLKSISVRLHAVEQKAEKAK